ncbi:VWA domain-containing protein [Granulicella sp. L60]|uniref:VWA domain-containing protein n=1 Tax=Granulicella sp. L60 TaxID=1641866 RepID=UPI00131AACF2|nr:VWA domain-containing protein [Granulicella sp. L60]
MGTTQTGNLMPRMFLSLLLLFGLCHRAYSQTVAPGSSGLTLHEGTKLVVVDVVVTDRSNQPVHGLGVSDFTLLENNDRQRIRNFEEHRGAAAGSVEAKALPPMPPGYFSNYTPVPAGSAVNVLLLDTLNTPVTDQIYLKDQIRKFLKEATPGAPIAIFGLTTHLTLLQSFTADPELLRAAINKKNSSFSVLLANSVTGGPTEKFSDDYAEFAASTAMGPSAASDSSHTMMTLRGGETQTDSNQLVLRAKYTLDAINQIARYLAGMPGRKNLMWFSGAFPIDILADSAKTNEGGEFESLESEFRDTTNLLTRGQVAMYPIDARGGVVSTVGDVSQSGAVYDAEPTRFAQDQLKFHQSLASDNATMRRMALETGGKAFLAENNLAGAVKQVVDLGSNYYTLAYSPSNPHWNGDYRKLQVNLERQGLTLAYRRGYYADDPDAPARGGRGNTAAAQTVPVGPSDPMRLAMMRGAPDSSQIALKIRVLPVSDKPEGKLAKGNTLSSVSRTKGPYRDYSVDLAANPHEVQLMKGADGNYRGYLQFVTYVYDQDGRLVNRVEDVMRANFTPALYAHVIATGLPFHQEVSVPMKGEYYVRVGMHDLGSNRVGAVEVPVSTVKDLAPLTASARVGDAGMLPK